MNETKKNTGLKIVVAILTIALLVCFIWINTLNNEINRLSNAMYSQHQTLMNQVESIYNNVENSPVLPGIWGISCQHCWAGRSIVLRRQRMIPTGVSQPLMTGSPIQRS